MTVQELINNLSGIINNNPKIANSEVRIATEDGSCDLKGIAGVFDKHNKSNFIMLCMSKLYKPDEAYNPFFNDYWRITHSLVGNVELQRKDVKSTSR